MNKKINKAIIIGILLFLLFLFLAFFIFFYNKNITKISIEEFEEIITSKNSAIVYYGQEECGACSAIFPSIDDLSSELKVRVNYLDADEIKNTDYLENLGIKYTPTIIVIDKGNVNIYEDLDYNLVYNILSGTNDTKIDRPVGLVEISYEQLEDKMNSNTDFVVYIGRSDCRDCEKFHPIVENFVSTNNNYGLYYFNAKALRDNSLNSNATTSDIDMYNNFKTKYDVQWFPSVYHIINGKIKIKYEYLDEKYYEIIDEEEKQKIIDKYEKEFIEWIHKCNDL